MVTQVFNLLRKIPVQLKLDFCVSLFSLLPQSPSFLLHRDKGERYDSTNFDVDTYIQSNSLPLWLKRHGGWGERECVCCKTISYQDNISNSIYDSQESTPTRTRNIPYPALTPEPKLKNKNENENATKILCPMFIGLLCLFIRYLKIMIDLMLFCLLFTRLSFAAFTPGGSCGQDIERREEREEWAVGSGQLLLEWSLITAGGAHSAFLAGASLQRTRWHSLLVTQPRTPAPLPQHTQCSEQPRPDPSTRYLQ